MCRSLPVSLRLNSSTQPSSITRSPFSAERPVVSVSRTIRRLMRAPWFGTSYPRRPARGSEPAWGEQALRSSVVFLGVVDRILGNLDRHILLRQDRLATQARLRLETPGAIEQVFLALFRFVERIEAFPHDDV